MTTVPRLRTAVTVLPAYKPGRRPAPGSEGVARLASNEIPDGPLPGVLKATAAATRELNRYPDPAALELVQAIADHYAVPAEHVVVGTGSVALGGQLIAAAAQTGDDVVFAWRSFEAYPIWVALAGAVPAAIPLRDDGSHDLGAMAAAVTPSTRAVILCSPNNPTGPALSERDVRRFCDAVPTDVLIVIDEAYREFVTDSDAVDAVAMYRTRPNVCVLRTFSKAYGLAALRVGYAIAHPTVTEVLRRTAIPFGVSTVAQAAARHSLASQHELHRRVDVLISERTRMCSALREAGWPVPDAQGNFLWLTTGRDTDSFERTCFNAQILVRPFAGEGCRVTIGTREENDRFLAIATGWAKDHLDQPAATSQSTPQR
jgi:histidinol-phosphate aminotransferase